MTRGGVWTLRPLKYKRSVSEMPASYLSGAVVQWNVAFTP